MTQVADYIQRAADRTKYKRLSYVERNIPTVTSNVYAIPFYGDISSTFILSSLLLKSYKEKHPDKYLILCSWPGFQSLFPYVDEYWALEDDSVTKTLAMGANNFYNDGELSTDITQSLIECVNIISHKEWLELYNCGFTDEYWNTFSHVNRYLPNIPSISKVTDKFRDQILERDGRKILVYPVTKMRSWQRGKSLNLPISKEFWDVLLERLLAEGYLPVVYQSPFTYDMSREFVERCVYVVPSTVEDLLTAMRCIGLVLDVFSGVSRLAIAARTPFLAVDERQRFMAHQDYAVDDLCCEDMPRQYIFSSSTMLMTGGPQEWNVSVIDNIIKRLENFNPEGDWGSTTELYGEVSYDSVRQRKIRRMGVTFINSSKNK